MWDTWRLERLLRNLLSNAVEYSPHGGPIKVRLHREQDDSGSWAVLAVDDHGLGIPDADLTSVSDLSTVVLMCAGASPSRASVWPARARSCTTTAVA